MMHRFEIAELHRAQIDDPDSFLELIGDLGTEGRKLFRGSFGKPVNEIGQGYVMHVVVEIGKRDPRGVAQGDPGLA